MPNFSDIIKSEVPVLIDFYATWCGPCQTMQPVLTQLKEEMGEQVKIIKIDVDKNPSIATKFNVRGVPAFFLFKNGQRVWNAAGVQSLRDLRELITAYS